MARLNLYCFPYAGGSAGIYYEWKQKLRGYANVEALEYKGHGTRMDEDFYKNTDDAVSDLLRFINTDSPENTVLFGYSFGSLIALETAFALREQGKNVKAVILAAQRPPHLLWKDRRLSAGSKEEAMAEIIKMGQIPEELLECEELLELFSDIIYSDLKLNENHKHDDSLPPLDVPIYVFTGTDDDEAPPDDMSEFSRYTSDSCKVISISGGHFFAFENSADFDREFNSALAELAGNI